MDKRMVFVVMIASIALLLFLGVALSFLFLGLEPNLSLFGSGEIALIELKGEISNDSGLLGTASSADEFVELIEKAEEDPSIAGILLEINSGGGSVVATKQVVAALKEAEKPKVAWISDIGASGAYYAAAACDYVMADEDSLTGSIGAISMLLNLSRLEEKHGIGMDVFASGEHKGMGSGFTELGEEEREIMQSLVKESWQGFKEDLLEFRGDRLDFSRLDEMFDGRIMNGRQALSYGLIDETGLKGAAIKKLGELTGSKEPRVREFSPKKSIFSIFGGAGYSFGEGLRQSIESDNVSLRS